MSYLKRRPLCTHTAGVCDRLVCDRRQDGSQPLDPSTFAPDRRPANVKPSPLAQVAKAQEPPIRCPWAHEPWAKAVRK